MELWTGQKRTRNDQKLGPGVGGSSGEPRQETEHQQCVPGWGAWLACDDSPVCPSRASHDVAPGVSHGSTLCPLLRSLKGHTSYEKATGVGQNGDMSGLPQWSSG